MDHNIAKKKPSADNKLVARHLATAFGGNPAVAEYRHDNLPLSVDLLWCDDRPCEGVSTYSNIGLSDYSMYTLSGTEFPTKIELAAACRSIFNKFANILATAAFCIIRTKKLYHPGSILRDSVREYYSASTVPHLYLTAPYLWEETLSTFVAGKKKVSWLLVVPISDAELAYLNENGDMALEALLEENKANIFDLDRASVI